MSSKLVVGNWKMHKTASQTRTFMKEFLALYPGPSGTETAVAPPFIALSAAGEALASTDVRLAAQNLFWADEGAYTGEISPLMLKDLGCTYVIVGHSERRQVFGEGNELINKKIHAALHHDLHPILCVGEHLRERESGNTESVITSQLLEGLKDTDPEQLGRITLAYEPVWAIGTGRAATVTQAAAVHAHIRSLLVTHWGPEAAGTRILYGGSVTPDNSRDLFQHDQINGALVGKACLNPESFVKILESALA